MTIPQWTLLGFAAWTDLQGPWVDALCIATLAARVIQSCVHISHEQTNAFVAVRFSFYSVQLVSFLVLIVMAANA